jgi:hypothetical protein
VSANFVSLLVVVVVISIVSFCYLPPKKKFMTGGHGGEHCDSSYLGARGKRFTSLRSALAKLARPCVKNIKQKHK